MRPAPVLEHGHHSHKHAFQPGGWFRRVEARAKAHIQQRTASPVNPISTPDMRRLEDGILEAAARLAQPLPHEVPKTSEGWAPGGWARNIAERASRKPQQEPVPARAQPDTRRVELSHPVHKMIVSTDSLSRKVWQKCLLQRSPQNARAAPDLVKRHRTAPGHPGLQTGIESRLHSRCTLSSAIRLLESPSFVAWQQGEASQSTIELDQYGNDKEKILDRIVGLEGYPCLYLMPKPRVDSMQRVSAMSPLRRARSEATLVKQPRPHWHPPAKDSRIGRSPSGESVAQQSSMAVTRILQSKAPAPPAKTFDSAKHSRSAPILTRPGPPTFNVGAAVLVASKESGFEGFLCPAKVVRLHRNAYGVMFPGIKVASCPHDGAPCRCACEVDRVESELVYPDTMPEFDTTLFLRALEPGMSVQYRHRGCAGWWALTIDKIVGELSKARTKIHMRSPTFGHSVYTCTVCEAESSLRPGVVLTRSHGWEFASAKAHKWAVAPPPDEEEQKAGAPPEIWKLDVTAKWAPAADRGRDWMKQQSK